jgi:hypothetical protein
MSTSISLHTMLAGIALAFVGTSAFAASLPISYTTTAPVTPYAGVTTGSGVITNANTPDSYYYGNSLSNLTNTLYTPSSGTYNGVNFEFYDDYVFTISGSTVNSVSSTISVGTMLSIDNLQARLYSTSSNPSLPVLGSPTGGVIDAWSTTYSSGGGNVTVSVLNATTLSAGTYVLELRGSVSGTAGGSYSGVLNIAPVPVPAAAWLMGSALLGLVGARRRR